MVEPLPPSGHFPFLDPFTSASRPGVRQRPACTKMSRIACGSRIRHSPLNPGLRQHCVAPSSDLRWLAHLSTSGGGRDHVGRPGLGEADTGGRRVRAGGRVCSFGALGRLTFERRRSVTSVAAMRDLASSGMLPVPPHHTCYLETFLGKMCAVGRALSLDNSEDARILRHVVSAIPDLAVAVQDNLEDYLRLFPEHYWRTLYDGPVVAVPVGPQQLVAYELAYLLQVVGWYKSLLSWEKATDIIGQLRNPPQIPSTFFEIETAAWCSARASTRSMEFFPEVSRNGRVTRPDYMWRTTAGDIYCECKRSSDFEDRFRRRLNSISTFLDRAVTPVIPDGLRLDFAVERTSGAEDSLQRLLHNVERQGEPGSHFVDGHVSVTVATRGSAAPPNDAMSYRTSTVPVSTSFVRAGPEGATHTLQVRATGYWQTVTTRLIRDARTQLPNDECGAVMVSLPSVAAAEAAKQKAEALIAQPAYVNTPWIALWAQGGATAVWRNNQPFDGRLCT